MPPVLQIETKVPDRLIGARDVVAITSLSRTTIWREVRRGTFPKPLQVSLNRIAWRESAVLAWRDSRPITMPASAAAIEPIAKTREVA